MDEDVGGGGGVGREDQNELNGTPVVDDDDDDEGDVGLVGLGGSCGEDDDGGVGVRCGGSC